MKKNSLGVFGVLVVVFGAFAQFSLIVTLLGNAADFGTVPAATIIAAYFISMAIYFVIDVAWVFGLEMNMLNRWFDKYYYERPSLQRPYLLAVFFVFAAAANTLVVVVPALEESGCRRTSISGPWP